MRTCWETFSPLIFFSQFSLIVAEAYRKAATGSGFYYLVLEEEHVPNFTSLGSPVLLYNEHIL